MKSLKDELLGALVGLSRASENKELSESAGDAIVQGLAMAFSDCGPLEAASVKAMILRLHEEKKLMAPDCAACEYPCGRTNDFDMEEVYGASASLRDAKLDLLSQLGTIALRSGGHASPDTCQFLSEALFLISCTYEASQLTGHLERAKTHLNTVD